MNRKKKIVLLFSFIIMMNGCRNDHKVVFEQYGEQLTIDEINFAIGNKKNANDSTILANIYIEDWKQLNKIYALAKKEGFEQDLKIQFLIRKTTKKIIAYQYINMQIGKIMKENKSIMIDSTEIKNFYTNHQDEFWYPEDAYKIKCVYLETMNDANFVKNIFATKQWTNMNVLFEKLGDSTKKKNKTAIDYSTTYQSISFIANLLKTTENKIESSLNKKVPIVTKIEEKLYAVVLSLEKKNKHDIKSFEDAKRSVADRLRSIKEKEILNRLIFEIANK